MYNQTIEIEIYDFLKNEMNNRNNFERDANIIDEGIIDSLGILSLVGFLENKFKVQIEFDDINQNNFNSVASIAKFITSLNKNSKA